MSAVYKKRAIPQATRRAVALAAGAVPGQTSPASCAYCGHPGSIYWPNLIGPGGVVKRPGAWVHFAGLELDHVHPEVLGGSNDAGNIVLACQPCNRRKGHRCPG